MPSRSVGLARYLWGVGASLVTLIVGAWLILAPFALGYQPYGADWASQTTNDFWVGIAAVLLSLVSLGLFVSSLMGSMRASGVIRPQVRVEPAPAGYPGAPSPAPSDSWERTMATLANALAEDLAERRRENSSPNAHSGGPVSPADRRDAA